MAVMQYQIAVTEAAHNVVLLHLLRCMGPMLEQNVRKNFELFYSSREMLATVSSHRAGIFEAIVAREQEKAREASHRYLAFNRRSFAGSYPGAYPMRKIAMASPAMQGFRTILFRVGYAES